jgi:LmbE family N-acetylglucosaminyl deacetylase
MQELLWLNTPVRTIYLSPHLDDAVLSAAGLIWLQSQAGKPVEIWTLMAGLPRGGAELPAFAQTMHRIWGFESVEQAIATRRNEDRQAAALVGATTTHFDFLDCIYRRGRGGEALYSEVTVPIPEEDAELPARIAEALSERLEPDDRVVCQLAIGRHVDHVIVRQAAEMLHRPLLYDADMPYVLNHPGELQPAVSGMAESLEPVSEAALGRWMEAIECYASQVDSVFGSHEAMREAMQAYWSEYRGVRLWEAPNGRPSTQ